MLGRIITANTIIDARRLAPSGKLNKILIPGTRTSIPTRPYTTEGMPARRFTAAPTTAFTFLLATFERNTAVKNPIGTPIRIAPPIPYTLDNMNGKIPNLGSAAVDAHS